MEFFKKVGSVFLTVGLLLALSAGCGTTAGSTSSSSASADTTDLVLSSEVSPDDLSFSSKDLDGSWDDSSAVHVTLADGNITVDGSGASADGSVLTITTAGTYVLTGTLTDGQIVVDASAEDKVQIVLNGADVTCSDSAAVYVKQADKVFLTVADNTANTLACGETFSDEATADEVTGAVFSHDDLTVNGSGSLTVNGNYKHGIVSKDDLVLAGVTLTVNSVSDGLRGKDCVKIASGTYTITAGTDGIQANNDSDTTLGFVYIAGGTYTITAGNDGIQAETLLCVTDGDFTVNTGGGSANASTKTDGGPTGGGQNGGPGGSWGGQTNSGTTAQTSGTPAATTAATVQTAAATGSSSDDTANTTSETTSDSAKALKSGTALVLAGGNYVIDSADDSVHSNGDVSVRDGCVLTASSGDDGIHADGTLSVSGGTITISKSYEGLEGETIDISGGTIHITASDDGLNAAGGSDSTTAGGPGTAAGTSSDGETPQLTISGGTLYVNASGDGLDSNGDLTVTGGEIYVDGPTNAGNGALDYGDGCTATISGGTVVAAGASGMAEAFGDSSTQCSILVIFDSSIAGGTELTVTDSSGKVVLSYTPSKDYQTAAISTATLAQGSTYTVAAGDVTVQVTLSGVSTTSGTQTSNGMGGGDGMTGGGPQGGNSQSSGSDTSTGSDSSSSTNSGTESGPPSGGGPQGGPSGGPQGGGPPSSTGTQTSGTAAT